VGKLPPELVHPSQRASLQLLAICLLRVAGIELLLRNRHLIVRILVRGFLMTMDEIDNDRIALTFSNLLIPHSHV
jgi:hypothetical protein